MAALIGPLGRLFIRKVKSRGQRLYSWTVNHEKGMDWCIRHGMDGVITDDPVKFLETCEHFQEHKKPSWPLDLFMVLAQVNIFAFLFTLIFWTRHGFGLKNPSQTKKNA